MKKSIVSTVVLVSICAVMAILLALTNSVTAPIIQKNQDAAANAALLEVMPNGKGFEKVEFDAAALPKTVTEVYKEQGGGYVITLTTTGYGSGLVIMCGVNAEGVVTGATCLASQETLGKEKTYGESFTGKDAAGVDALDTISGATKTTTAYKNAIKDALNSAIILGGGSVDIRTPEEILNENLTQALPAGESAFTKPFIAEVIEGIDAVYTADNGAGSVYVIGESFYGVPAGGTSENETVAAAHAILSASEIEELDLSDYTGLPKTLISAKKTATGNFILETKGAGYSSKNPFEQYGYETSGKPIVVRVSITPEGKIIDTFTVSQDETPNIGDVCAKEEFYGLFDGATEETYETIDAVSSATFTYTRDGYLSAIRDAFKAVKILKGGDAQ